MRVLHGLTMFNWEKRVCFTKILCSGRSQLGKKRLLGQSAWACVGLRCDLRAVSICIWPLALDHCGSQEEHGRSTNVSPGTALLLSTGRPGMQPGRTWWSNLVTRPYSSLLHPTSGACDNKTWQDWGFAHQRLTDFFLNNISPSNIWVMGFCRSRVRQVGGSSTPQGKPISECWRMLTGS